MRMPALPFAVEQVDILGSCTPLMWAVLREAGPSGSVRKLDIDLCDEAGYVRVRIRGYTSRVLDDGGKKRARPSQVVTSGAEPPARGHPLIDADLSSPGECVFGKWFSDRDSILRDHVFDGVRVLPAAAIIEMAREAVARIGARPRQITNFLMGYPVVGTEQGIDTRLVLKPVGERIDFTLTSRDRQSGQPLIHSQGTIETGERGERDDSGILDLDAIRARLPHRADLEHNYDVVVPHAVEFGPTLRTLRAFSYGGHEALAKIVVSEEDRRDDLVLHPLIIDGVFQAGAVSYYYRRQGFQPSVLFAIDRLEIFGPTGDTCDVHLTLLDSGHGDTMAFDATICHESGRIVARLTQVTIKVAKAFVPARTRGDTPAQTEPVAQTRIEQGADLFQQTEAYLKAAIARVVKIPADRIDVHEDFGNYGIDSLTIMHLNDRLSEDFQALPRTLFFEYITVHDLTAYFVTHHAERLELLLRQTATSERGLLYGATPRTECPLPPGEGQGEGGSEGTKAELVGRTMLPRQPWRFTRPMHGARSDGAQEPPPAEAQLHDVAIIGLAGRYPGAERLDQFWENLKLGRDCIREIPAEAWNYHAIYDPERQRQNAIACKWGGSSRTRTSSTHFFSTSPRSRPRPWIPRLVSSWKRPGTVWRMRGTHQKASLLSSPTGRWGCSSASRPTSINCSSCPPPTSRSMGWPTCFP